MRIRATSIACHFFSPVVHKFFREFSSSDMSQKDFFEVPRGSARVWTRALKREKKNSRAFRALRVQSKHANRGFGASRKCTEHRACHIFRTPSGHSHMLGQAVVPHGKNAIRERGPVKDDENAGGTSHFSLRQSCTQWENVCFDCVTKIYPIRWKRAHLSSCSGGFKNAENRPKASLMS